jgi:branched-chain amino acid transport system ATP-binding protein
MLEVQSISIRYGRLTVVRDLSLTVARGEVVCVLGQNGAGKSSVMAAIAGGIAPYRGNILFEQTPILARAPEYIARLGISFIPEGRRVFPELTVQENLLVGGAIGRGRPADDLSDIYAYFPRLEERQSAPARQLSGGEQQMLAIGRALMTHPTLMLIDEPSLGLAPRIVDQVYEILLHLRSSRGMTLLVNEQSTTRILRYADRIYVLRNGSIQLEGETGMFRGGDAIQKAYFGFEEGGAPAAADGHAR